MYKLLPNIYQRCWNKFAFSNCYRRTILFIFVFLTMHIASVQQVIFCIRCLNSHLGRKNFYKQNANYLPNQGQRKTDGTKLDFT